MIAACVITFFVFFALGRAYNKQKERRHQEVLKAIRDREALPKDDDD